MEFDKSRVYTAVNADELMVGSKCIFADSLATLKYCVETENPRIRILEEIEKENYTDRFIWNDTHNCYHMNLAYLIEPPAEPKYKPFESVEKAMETIIQHGGWVKDKKNNVQLLVVGFDDDNGFFLGNGYSCSYTGLFLDYVFVNDGSPCGELLEEK
ncbi:MAG: hypothetical protein ACTTH8_08385 [Treponema sp.]